MLFIVWSAPRRANIGGLIEIDAADEVWLVEVARARKRPHAAQIRKITAVERVVLHYVVLEHWKHIMG